MENCVKLKTQLFAFFFLFLSFQCHADIGINHDFDYLNQLRADAGLIPFNWNEQLADASQNHANYLSMHNTHGHEEDVNLSLFTGQWATERAIYSNYDNRLVGENVTSKSGDNTYYNPVDSLMSAIYHRFGFLTLINDEIGIGHQAGNIYSYVYVMGSSRISRLCRNNDFDGIGQYNYNVCRLKDKKIDKLELDSEINENQEMNADVILWPPRDAINVMPVFYQESPDPLPYHDVSGYPVSVQFNPSNFKKAPQVLAFKLFKADSNELQEAIMIMNKTTDPNKQFNEYQHALFPEHRLDWNTEYRVQFDFFNPNNNKVSQLSWNFVTQDLKKKVVTIYNPRQTVPINPLEDIVLYFPPKNAKDVNTSLNYKDFQMKLKLNYIDKNTLNAYASRRGKAIIRFHNKEVELIAY